METATPAMKLTLLGKQENAHEDGVWSAAWAPTSADTPGGIVVTGSVDETVKLWQVSARFRTTFETPREQMWPAGPMQAGLHPKLCSMVVDWTFVSLVQLCA